MTEWIDEIGLPEVIEFTRAELAPFDLSKLDWFKLLPLPKERYSGECTYPVRTKPRARSFRHGYRIRACVCPEADYPWDGEIVTGSETLENGDWDYLCTDVRFLDLAEMAVFVAGHEAFHFLRNSGQIVGRNTEPQANLGGLRWVQAWKCR
ncbi:MAG: hypothetical protein QNK05_20830 [Myxococcota bacterium]|nr:hypothetical protein [Myxococcota bacterium]